MTEEECIKLINDAAVISGDDNKFIVGCRNFLKEAGFLTEKQIKCLKNPFPKRKYYHNMESDN